MANGLITDHAAPKVDVRYLDWNSRLTVPKMKPRYAYKPRSSEVIKIMKRIVKIDGWDVCARLKCWPFMQG